MMVMTLPWHYLGLHGQWRRVATFDYADPIIAGWGPWVVVSLVGGVILLASGLLFVRNLVQFAVAREPYGGCAERLRDRGTSAGARAGGAERLRGSGMCWCWC